MPMVNEFYNLTNTSGGFINLVTGTNNALNSLPMLGLIISFFVIMFIGMLPAGVTKSFVTSGFVTGIIGIMFTLAGLITPGYLGIFIVLLALIGGSIIIYNKNNGANL